MEPFPVDRATPCHVGQNSEQRSKERPGPLQSLVALCMNIMIRCIHRLVSTRLPEGPQRRGHMIRPGELPLRQAKVLNVRFRRHMGLNVGVSYFKHHDILNALSHRDAGLFWKQEGNVEFARVGMELTCEGHWCGEQGYMLSLPLLNGAIQ